MYVRGSFPPQSHPRALRNGFPQWGQLAIGTTAVWKSGTWAALIDGAARHALKHEPATSDLDRIAVAQGLATADGLRLDLDSTLHRLDEKRSAPHADRGMLVGDLSVGIDSNVTTGSAPDDGAIA
jgi:hypothetical protein